uniref:Uncharacterized protein n=1 Tax=Candidatus Kentrum sp. TC TaxID=2126339 RepID=A0A450ZTU8_9GAMM|nr:MAG: hypothetical protein BECKTC1821F_GA0114240_101547 [Candidatus Kentron sp. TC]
MTLRAIRLDISERTHLHFIPLHDDPGFRPGIPRTARLIGIRAVPFLVGIFVDAVYRVRHTMHCILRDTDSNYIRVSEKNSEQTGARARPPLVWILARNAEMFFFRPKGGLIDVDAPGCFPPSIEAGAP